MVKSKTIKEKVFRLVILLVGLTIAHFGVTLFLMADLGSDPFNVLVQGSFISLQKLLGGTFLTHGRVHITMCFLIILILLVVDRSYIKLGTIVCMVFGGPIIDVFTKLLGGFVQDGISMPGRIAMLALGCVILAYGMTIVIKSEAGTGPNDLVSVVLCDKIHGKFGVVRILVDLVFVIIGFILGGTVGVGTIICVGVIGPVAGLFMPINEKVIQKIIIKVQ